MTTKAHLLKPLQLRSCIHRWQSILGLRDWHVFPEIARRDRFAHQRALGEISWTAEHREATLRVLDPVDFAPESVVPQDMEKTVVHELVHLLFVHMPTLSNDTEKTLFEQAIGTLTDALVTLERRGGQPCVRQIGTSVTAAPTAAKRTYSPAVPLKKRPASSAVGTEKFRECR